MHKILVIVGVLVTVAGAVLIAFGIPNSGGDINTAIIAGTTVFVGGLVLIALSEAVRQLRRIAESLMIRPVGRMPRANDQFEPAVSATPAAPAASRVPFPPKTEPLRRESMQAPEPHVDLAPSLDVGEDHFERTPPAFARNAPEPRVRPERDEALLSPTAAAPRFTAARDDKDELSEGLLATAFSRLDVSMRPAPPIAEPQKQQNEMFDTLWPPERKTAATESMPRSAEPEGPYVEPPMDEPPEEEQPPYAVSILKSGVVDGMAYTLYSDGSIEAEMPQGTMRFASIIELRGYLEKSSS